MYWPLLHRVKVKCSGSGLGAIPPGRRGRMASCEYWSRKLARRAYLEYVRAESNNPRSASKGWGFTFGVGIGRRESDRTPELARLARKSPWVPGSSIARTSGGLRQKRRQQKEWNG